MKKLRIGTINWDAVLPKSTYFGGYTVRNLGNEKYKSRLHFSANKYNGEYDFHYRTQEEYDKELQYAIDGGIDFFAYCWYPDSNEKRNIWHENKEYEFLMPHYPELNTARHLYQTSKLNKKIKMCAIIFSCSAYAESDFDALVAAMNENYYEKIDGKPLVIVFGGYSAEFVKIIRECFYARKITPYIALIDNSGRENPDGACNGIDAVTAYASVCSASSFSELNKHCNEENYNRLHYKLPVIPLMTVGWNPSPRVDNPSPWVKYNDVAYAGTPDISDIKEGFSLICDFISNNKEYATTGCAIVFAWNEFEEGGYLCPTINEDGSVNDRIIKDFAIARKEALD